MAQETEQLRNEIQQARERMSDTLDQLGNRLNPQRIKAEVRQNVKDATIGRVGDMARNAADRVSDSGTGIVETIRSNPIPAAMIGVGLGWLLFSGRSGSRNRRPEELTANGIGDLSATTPRLKQDDAAGGVGASISTDGSGVSARVSAATAEVGHRISHVADQAGDKLSDLADDASNKLSEVGARTSEHAHHVEERAQAKFREQPLAAGAALFAAGLAAGLAIPESRREAELLRPARERIAARAREKMEDVKDRVEDVADEFGSETSAEINSFESRPLQSDRSPMS